MIIVQSLLFQWKHTMEVRITAWAKSYMCSVGHVPSTPPSLLDLLARTYVGTLPRREPMWQYPVKIINIQLDVTFIIPKLIDGGYHMSNELNGLSDRTLNVLSDQVLPCCFPTGKSSHVGVGRLGSEEVWEGQGPVEHRCDLRPYQKLGYNGQI